MQYCFPLILADSTIFRKRNWFSFHPRVFNPQPEKDIGVEPFGQFQRGTTSPPAGIRDTREIMSVYLPNLPAVETGRDNPSSCQSPTWS
jgi:hypothetical protein